LPENHDLARFISAQRGVYDAALAELRAGAKRRHWMWFVFPQLAGLGRSETARFYALSGLGEAQAYAAHELLGPRLRECTDAMLGWAGRRSAEAILGGIDALKFASCMTLFEAACPDQPRFGAALDAFYGGQRDETTLELLAAK
jgi:uncharacterized protein (DUF1810 family)